jgi:hypothetical protein
LNPEDGVTLVLRNVGIHRPYQTAYTPEKPQYHNFFLFPVNWGLIKYITDGQPGFMSREGKNFLFATAWGSPSPLWNGVSDVLPLLVRESNHVLPSNVIRMHGVLPPLRRYSK